MEVKESLYFWVLLNKSYHIYKIWMTKEKFQLFYWHQYLIYNVNTPILHIYHIYEKIAHLNKYEWVSYLYFKNINFIYFLFILINLLYLYRHRKWEYLICGLVEMKQENQKKWYQRELIKGRISGCRARQ